MGSRAIWAYPGGEIRRTEKSINRMSLKEIDVIQTIVDARRVTLQEEYAASFLPGDRVKFIAQDDLYFGTIIESKDAAVAIDVDDVHHARTVETVGAIWWLRAEKVSRSNSPAPTKKPLDTDS